jgi:hypothetical protein
MLVKRLVVEDGRHFRRRARVGHAEAAAVAPVHHAAGRGAQGEGLLVRPSALKVTARDERRRLSAPNKTAAQAGEKAGWLPNRVSSRRSAQVATGFCGRR